MHLDVMTLLKRLTWKQAIGIIFLFFVIVYPLLGASKYHQHLFIFFFILGIVAINWNLLMGYAGITSLGNIGFLAIGGYTSGILSKMYELSPWITIPIGGIVTSLLVTIFLGLPALRLRGIYIALLTLIFADSLPSILTQTRDITGGAMGLHAIPPLMKGMEKVHGLFIKLLIPQPD